MTWLQLDKAFVCHFYGWRPKDIEAMGYGEFLTYHRSATMIQAQRDMAELQFSSYPDMKKEYRDKVWRGLKQAASHYIAKEVKDYKEVIKNLALNLMGQKHG